MTTGKLYLHMGPPKTATTSLQIALQKADLPGLHYGGTFQPRENNVGSFAQTLHKASCGRLAAGDADGRSAFDEIGEHLGGGNLILSEEMFLVEQRDNPFPEKLRRLGDLLSDIPTVVLVTLRDPREGLPSLYQELFKSLPLSEKLSFARFCRGPRARCYAYTFVHQASHEQASAIMSTFSSRSEPLTPVMRDEPKIEVTVRTQVIRGQPRMPARLAAISSH